MYLFIGGVNCSPYVKENGITRGYVYRATRSRVTLGGKRYVSKVKKLNYGIVFEHLEESTLKSLVEALNGDTVSMVYKDPVLGTISKQFIATPADTELAMEDSGGVTYWSGFEVTMEEQ